MGTALTNIVNSVPDLDNVTDEDLDNVIPLKHRQRFSLISDSKYRVACRDALKKIERNKAMKSMEKEYRIDNQSKAGAYRMVFLLPAALLIFAMNFYPMLQALVLSFKTGIGNNQVWGGAEQLCKAFAG